MIKTTFSIFLLFFVLNACNKKKGNNKLRKEPLMITNTDKKFENIIQEIRKSDVYENPEKWESRGLNISKKKVIITLSNATNDFLDKLEVIYSSNESSEKKLKQVTNMVDALPWNELDTEEKEFMADELAPAIKAAGFDPWSIF